MQFAAATYVGASHTPVLVNVSEGHAKVVVAVKQFRVKTTVVSDVDSGSAAIDPTNWLSEITRTCSDVSCSKPTGTVPVKALPSSLTVLCQMTGIA